jgi:hypothetical protein
MFFGSLFVMTLSPWNGTYYSLSPEPKKLPNCGFSLRILADFLYLDGWKADILSPIFEPRKRQGLIMQIKSTNIILYCKKWEETVAFYQTGLHLPITVSTEWFVEFEVTRTSRVSVADEYRTSIKSAGGRGITITLQVTDVETTHTQLKNARLNPTTIKEVWGAKSFYVFDPEGNRIEFWSGRPKQ